MVDCKSVYAMHLLVKVRWNLGFFASLLLFWAGLLQLATSARAAVRLTTIASGLVQPLYATSAGDGSGRLFIVEQGGRIRILANGSLLPTPFLDITNQVASGGELGLLGLAFHPDYRSNGRFFVNYTRRGAAGLETVIAEFSVSSGDPNRAAVESQKTLLTIAQPFENHNGGMVGFGPDGYLYIATGDGGGEGDPQGNAQNLNSLLGKILRINVNSGTPYGIPSDNPFANAAGRDEIYAYGLRNPFRFSFDRATGRLFAGDVGQNRFEEVDIITRGGNYGWNVLEGTHCFMPETGCSTAGTILPIIDYGRSDGTTVTGGYVYRGRNIPSLVGKYVFGDFGSGMLWALTESAGQWRRETLLSTGLLISSFGEDDAGELYLVDYRGTVRRIDSDETPRPSSGLPEISPRGIVNAASYRFGAIAPGELVSIFGAGLGPFPGVGAQLNAAGRIATSTGGVQVFFDEFAAPLLFAQDNQLNVQVPYELQGRTKVEVRVMYQGVSSAPVTMPVVSAAPGLFTTQFGEGQASALNANFSLNSFANPARRGSVISLFLTGEGRREPDSADGALASPPLARPALPVSVAIGSIIVPVEFAGAAPGFAGLMQVNVLVPRYVPTGAAVPVVVSVGGATTQSGATIALY